MVIDMVVILSGVWLPMPKYSGTNASHMTHVVYIVKPVEQIVKFYINTFVLFTVNMIGEMYYYYKTYIVTTIFMC